MKLITKLRLKIKDADPMSEGVGMTRNEAQQCLAALEGIDRAWQDELSDEARAVLQSQKNYLNNGINLL